MSRSVRLSTRGMLGRRHQMALVTAGMLDQAFALVVGGTACLTITSAGSAVLTLGRC